MIWYLLAFAILLMYTPKVVRAARLGWALRYRAGRRALILVLKGWDQVAHAGRSLIALLSGATRGSTR